MSRNMWLYGMSWEVWPYPIEVREQFICEALLLYFFSWCAYPFFDISDFQVLFRAY